MQKTFDTNTLKHQHPFLRIIMVCFGMLAFVLLGCAIIDVGPPVNAIVTELDKAINILETQSMSWQNVLEETRDKLIKEGQSTVANEVSNVLSRAISDVGIEARCYTDFLRDRVKEDLIRLRAKYTGENISLKPVFCNPTPKVIDMNLSPERRPYIEISGYNLDVANIKVLLIDNQNNRVDISKNLASPTQYLLTLNLGRDGVPLSENSFKIEFELPGETRSVSIIQPPIATPTPSPVTYKIELRTMDVESAPAASDGRVWITLVGIRGSTNEIQVEGDFRRGEIESKVFTYQDIGPIQNAIIRYDDGRKDNAWLLDHVKVTNQTTNQELWFYNCRIWLGHQNPLMKPCR